MPFPSFRCRSQNSVLLNLGKPAFPTIAIDSLYEIIVRCVLAIEITVSRRVSCRGVGGIERDQDSAHGCAQGSPRTVQQLDNNRKFAVVCLGSCLESLSIFLGELASIACLLLVVDALEV